MAGSTAHDTRLSGAVAAAREATARALEAALLARDAAEAGHLDRTTAYATALAERIDPRIASDPDALAGFRLHDVGKLALPDTTLHRRGPLTARDWRLLHNHPRLGAEMIEATGIFDGAAAVIRCHHERWDGLGYPAKAAGDEIPLEARIFAVADALDAITTDRPHRESRTLADAREAIRAGAGTQFDPRVADALESIRDDELERIRGATDA